MPTMHVPGIGTVDKKYVYIGAAGTAGFVAYMYWRNRNAAATDVTDPSTDTSTTDPAAVDYSSDYAGYMGSYDMSGSSPVYQSPPSVFVPVPSDNQITSDGAWDAAVVAAAGDLGIDNTTGQLSGALGRYLAGQCLTAQQADWVRTAQGMFGMPPQHPTLQIKICPPTGDGGSTGTKLAAPSGLHVVKTDTSGVQISWTALSGSSGYYIKITGGKLNHTVQTTATTYRIGALHRKTTYHFAVAGYNAAGTGAFTGSVSGKTK